MWSASLTLRFKPWRSQSISFHIVEIKGMLFKVRMHSSSQHVKSSIFDVARVLLNADTGCASRFSDVCLCTVTTPETIYNTWVIISTGPIFQLLLERPLPVSWLSNYSYIQRPQDYLQGLGYLVLALLSVAIVPRPQHPEIAHTPPSSVV